MPFNLLSSLYSSPASLPVDPVFVHSYNRAFQKIFRENINPFRCVGLDEKEVVADLNHPLAGIPIQISFTADQKQVKNSEMGGTCTEWLDMALSGPGMQSRWNGSQTDFFLRMPLTGRIIRLIPFFIPETALCTILMMQPGSTLKRSTEKN
ncbi:MAG: hypothetical protein U9P10_04920 [Thermodesulfobacteriota bacterium]|nr:hypothetical protein [Thermodesulfobacteriota bacterium]